MERDARFLVDLLRDRHPVVRELGQHYLVDTSVLNAAIELAGDISNQHILEIGYGPGSLTHHLLHAGARVSAIAIDEGSLEHMQRHFKEEIESEQLTLFVGDALTVKWPEDIDAIVARVRDSTGRMLVVVSAFQGVTDRLIEQIDYGSAKSIPAFVSSIEIEHRCCSSGRSTT